MTTDDDAAADCDTVSYDSLRAAELADDAVAAADVADDEEDCCVCRDVARECVVVLPLPLYVLLLLLFEV